MRKIYAILIGFALVGAPMSAGTSQCTHCIIHKQSAANTSACRQSRGKCMSTAVSINPQPLPPRHIKL